MRAGDDQSATLAHADLAAIDADNRKSQERKANDVTVARFMAKGRQGSTRFHMGSQPRDQCNEFRASFSSLAMSASGLGRRRMGARPSSYLGPCFLTSRRSALRSFGEAQANARAKRKSGPAPDTVRRVQDAPHPTTALGDAMPRRERRPNGANRC